MSVQIIRWIILLMMIGNLVPDSCKTDRTEKLQNQITACTTTIENPTANLLNSFMSLLHFNAGDLTEENTHTTLDKKAFIKLFLYLRYSDMSFPKYSRNTSVSREFLYNGSDQTDYYIYTLQKIII